MEVKRYLDGGLNEGLFILIPLLPLTLLSLSLSSSFL